MKLLWLLSCLLAITFAGTLEEAKAEYDTLVKQGSHARRRRLISVQKTLTKIKHHIKRGQELRAALKAELEKRHRAIAEKMRKQIEEQRKEMLGAHKGKMKKLATQMQHFRKQMAHHKKMESEMKEKMTEMKQRLKKVHGIEMGEDGQFRRMKDKFGSTDGNDNSVVAKAVAKAKARARQRLNKARDRMMKVLQQSEVPEMAQHRDCLKKNLKNLIEAKGHLPNEKESADYSDSADVERHAAHMMKARSHLTKALEASKECHKIHQGPFHEFGEEDDYSPKSDKKGTESEVQSPEDDSSDYLGYDDSDEGFRRRLISGPTILAA